MKYFLKFIPILSFWGVLIFVIVQIPYPESLSQTNIIQIMTFFIPLYLALTFSINIFLKNVFISASLSLGIIFLLILKALDSLNLVTVILIIIAIYLLISSFRKSKRANLNPIKSDLTKWSKIPKITRLKRRK